jgi:hypothetical protein
MKTITLYRPVDLKELILIIESNFSEFPPRLNWQPIFYPVMNEEYAVQIALKWNTIDEFSGYSGFVTAFKMDAEFIEKYEIHNVGGKIHNELWVPADKMNLFNSNILEKITVTKSFLGKQFKNIDNNLVMSIIKNTKVEVN